MPPKGSAKKKKPAAKRKASDEAGPSATKRSSAAINEAAEEARPDETTDPASAQREDEEEQQQDGPTYEDLRRAALQLMLSSGLSLPQEKADRALDATQQHKDDAALWVDEAQVWLACEAECAEEADKMGAAMEVSLVEEEQRRAAKKPLVELTAGELLAEFGASELLASLGAALSAGDLQAALELETLKPKFIEYLELEQKCKKWWKCSKGWFASAAKQLTEELPAAQPRNGDAAGGAENVAAAAALAEVADSEAGGANESGQAEQQRADGTSMEVQEKLFSFLKEQVPFIRNEAYAMPAGGNRAIPLVFEAFVESAEVVLVE